MRGLISERISERRDCSEAGVVKAGDSGGGGSGGGSDSYQLSSKRARN